MTEVVQNRAKGLGQLHLEGIIIQCLAVLKVDGSTDRTGVRRLGDLGEGKRNIAGLQLFAVVELHALAEVEDVGAVVLDIPGLCQHRSDVAFVIAGNERLKDTVCDTDGRGVSSAIGVEGGGVGPLCYDKGVLCSVIRSVCFVRAANNGQHRAEAKEQCN